VIVFKLRRAQNINPLASHCHADPEMLRSSAANLINSSGVIRRSTHTAVTESFETFNAAQASNAPRT
jgi:hypothetical protein